VTVTGVVLAAGGSSRLGRPKQLLPYAGTTLLGATLARASGFGLDQVVVTLGAAADAVLERVDLTGLDVVRTGDAGSGCSASLTTALDAVRPDADGIVLLLGDQPGVTAGAVAAVRGTGAAAAVCRYAGDSVGHPFWFARETFADLRALHGDKGVWRLLESGRYDVAEVPLDGPVPLDVDTMEDYLALLDATPGAR
jgi:molybdenum cofactor cytidylyltransferase